MKTVALSDLSGEEEKEQEQDRGSDECEGDQDQESLQQEDASKLGEALNQVSLVGAIGGRDVQERLGCLK